jgi:hypothetical protein
METETTERELIRQYLLGALEGKPLREFEERLFCDAAFLDEIDLAEDEVVYEYVSGALSAQEKSRFEGHYLSTPERRLRLKLFAALKNKVESTPAADDAPPRSEKHFLPAFMREGYALRLSLAVISVAIVLGGWLLVFRGGGAKDESPRLIATLKEGQERGDGPDGGERPAELTRVHVPFADGLVELRLPVAGSEQRSYSATLFADKGEVKLTRNDLGIGTTAEGQFVSFRVESSVLTRGDYRVRLRARAPDGEFREVGVYSFRVSKD